MARIVALLLAVVMLSSGGVLLAVAGIPSPGSPVSTRGGDVGAGQLAEARASLNLAAAPAHGWKGVTTVQVPPKVSAEVLVYDAADHYVLLFGGRDKWTSVGGPFLGETWMFANHSWSPVPNVTVAPSARGHAAFAYDATDGYVVVFGGLQQGGGPTGGGVLYDTWTYHAGKWTKLTLRVHPSGRYEASMAYDTTSQRVILFGGTAGGNETWQFHAGRWSQLHPAVAPTPRRFAMMTDFPPLKELILFGGCSAASICSGPYNDTWSFSGGNWTQVFAYPAPHVRMGSAIAYDPLLQGAIVFGGANSTSLLGDTWLFHTNRWSSVCSNCGPNPRWLAVAATLPGPGSVLMYGGNTINGFTNQTWEFT